MVKEGGELCLTDLGRKKAEEIYSRHKLLTFFLQKTAGVDLATAEKDACKMEHILSDAVIAGIKRYMDIK